MKGNRAISTKELLTRNFKTLQLSEVWANFLGEPQITGSFFIWGGSGSGKTHFTLQFAKELAQFGKVIYDSLEEGASKSMRDAIDEAGMLEVGANFYLLDMERYQHLYNRLKADRKIKFVIIDSLQYFDIQKEQYWKLKNEFKNKLFIYVSHADGKAPAGQLARDIRYDAFVKIWVEGYKAFPQSRYGGGSPYVIWQEGADKYWVE